MCSKKRIRKQDVSPNIAKINVFFHTLIERQLKMFYSSPRFHSLYYNVRHVRSRNNEKGDFCGLSSIISKY